LIRLRCR